MYYAPCLVLVEHSVGSNTNDALTPPQVVQSRQCCYKAIVVMRRMGASGCLRVAPYITLLALCLLSTLCVMNQLLIYNFSKKLSYMKIITHDIVKIIFWASHLTLSEWYTPIIVTKNPKCSFSSNHLCFHYYHSHISRKRPTSRYFSLKCQNIACMQGLQFCICIFVE